MRVSIPPTEAYEVECQDLPPFQGGVEGADCYNNAVPILDDEFADGNCNGLDGFGVSVSCLIDKINRQRAAVDGV